jgi:N-acetylmuramoyl-L-alanine amidase
MITAVFLTVLQLAEPAVAAITVRDGGSSTRVPVVPSAAGPAVRASAILPLLGGTLTRVPPDRVTVSVAGANFELTIGSPFARVKGQVAPLSTAPHFSGNDVLLPLALIAEVMPRYGSGMTWEPSSRVLSRNRAVVERAGEVSRPAAARRDPPPRRLVVIDAGHGGPDRGMSGTTSTRRRIEEADITLAVSRKLRDVLKARGVDVLMTRTTDTLIALRDRGRLANEAGGTLFLSIHVNAANPRWSNPRSARGFETYFLSDAKTEDERRVAEMENEADKYLEDAEPGDPLTFLLSDMAQNSYLRESSELAATVQAGLRPTHPSRADRGVKQAGFAVLIAAHMPAALVEIGFGTNAAEATWLSSAKGQETLANAIADATERYLDGYARRGGMASSGR